MTKLIKHGLGSEQKLISLFEPGYKCHFCPLKFFTKSESAKHARTHIETKLNAFIYKGKTITMPFNVKKGICSKCGKSGYTQLHHLSYHDDNPLKDTIELCASCHGKWHSENTPNWGKPNL